MKKKYAGYIFPSMLSFLLSGIYSIVDGIFVGKAMGDDGLTAINIAWPLIALIISLGTGIGMGASVEVALNKGSGDLKKADRMEGNAFTLLLSGAVILTALLALFGRPLLIFLGAEGTILSLAETYLYYILIGSIIQVMASGLVPLMRNRGATFYAMISMACGCITNIILDYYFVWILNAGLKGAALATVFGQALTLLFCIAFYLKEKNRISIKNMIPSVFCIRGILKVAISPFGLTYLPSVTIILMNLQCLKYGGEEAVSAYAVLAYLLSFMELMVQGISDGSQPLLSHCEGSGNRKALKSYTIWTFFLGITLSVLSGALVYLGRNIIPEFYGTSSQAAGLIVHAAPTFAAVMILYGFTKPTVSYFYATHKVFHSSFLVYGEVALTIALIILLPMWLGLDGVWLTMPAVQCVLSALSVRFLLKH